MSDTQFAEPRATSLLPLAASLCARLCHDIASPLGALQAVLEEGEAGASAFGAEAASRLIARLRLLRAAWAGGAGSLDGPAIEALAAGLPRRQRVDLKLDLPTLSEPQARLALMLLIVGAESLPFGGTIKLSAAPDLRLELSGRRAAWPENFSARVEPEPSPRTLAGPLACLHAQAQGIALQLEPPGRDPDTLRLVAIPR